MSKILTSKPTDKTNLVHPHINKMPVNTNSIEALNPDTDKKVHGTFINVETPGQPARICGKFYRGQEYFSKTFLDNEKCTIPLSIARFINERCQHEKHSQILDEKGNPLKTNQYYPRYKFMIEEYVAA